MTHSNDIVLIKLDAATVALKECKTAIEAKHIADVAEAARVYLERTNASVETVNRATEIRLLAERQMGAFLKTMPKNHGSAGQLIGPGVIGTKTSEVPTLKEIGITHYESHSAQKLADIPEPEFIHRIDSAKASGEKITRTAITRTQRVRTVFTMPAWKQQARSVMTSWLQSVPKHHRADAVTFLSELPAAILTKIQ